MACSSLLILAVLLLAINFANPLQPHVRINSRLARAILDENYIDTPGATQNLCGDSTFDAVGHDGPLRYDCEYLISTTKRNPDGFWMVGNFGSDGTAWAELTRLRTCGIQVRRTDGQRSDVPFGDDDVVDLVNSSLAEFSVGKYLPTVQGHMTCSRMGSSAAVEWQIFSV